MRPVGSTLISPRSGEPARARPARSRRRGRAARGRARRWCAPAGARPRSAANRRTARPRRTALAEHVARPSATASGVPAGGLHGLDQRAGRRLDRVGRRCSPAVPSSARPSASRRPGSAYRAAPTSAGPAASPAPGRPGPAPAGAAPSTCRPSRICASLISHSQPSTCRMKLVELGVVRPVGQAQVVVELGGLDQRPDLRADRGQLRRVHRGDRGVLVEQLLQPGDVAVGLGAGHRRHQVVDQRGVRPALGLRALARVVDQERVDQRQVAERGVGAARRRHARRSCRAATPGCRACRRARSRARRTRRAASGRRPGSGGWAAGRGRGRSRSGSRPNPRGGCTITTTLPARSAARTMSPSLRSTNSSPGAGPQWRSIAARRSAGRVPNQRSVVARRRCAPGCPRAAPR